jgi:hypothetical protein
MFAHCAIHGVAVGIVLSPVFGACEFTAHALTDWAKSEGLIGFNADQGIHLMLKAIWVMAYSHFL